MSCEGLSEPAVASGSCPTLCPQGTVAGAPKAEGVLLGPDGILPASCCTMGVHV